MKQKTCCQRIARYLCTNLDEEFSSPRCREIKKHLQHCSTCASLLHSLKATIQLYKKEVALPRLSGKERAQRFEKLLSHIKNTTFTRSSN